MTIPWIPFLLFAALSPGSALDSPDPPELEALRRELIDPFLKEWKGKLAAPRARESLHVPLRALVKDMDGWLGAHLSERAQRRTLSLAARDLLLTGLAVEVGGTDSREAAESLLKSAVKEHNDRRIENLERSIICWCLNENWTRTLSGCAEPCADEQKALVIKWLDEGSTDDEIIERMVAHPKGGPKVRAVPELSGTNWLAFIFPVLLFGSAAVLVAFVLHRVTRRGKLEARGKESTSTDADSDWDQRIERELKEMEG